MQYVSHLLYIFRYLLLVIYALFNLNDVSWGTREVPKSAADLAAEAESTVQEATKVAAVKKEGLLGYFQVPVIML